MATNTFVTIDMPEAEKLAAYTGIDYDLSSASEFASKLLVSIRGGDYSLAEPMTIAILVRYSRPFLSGVRMHLGQEALNSLNEEQQTQHRYFMAIRGKHLAHSVNEFEENQPVARYWVERVHDEGIESVSCNHTRVIGLGVRDLEFLLEIIEVLRRHVDGILVQERAKLLAVVRSKPLDEILNGGKSPGPTSTDPSKRRKTF